MMRLDTSIFPSSPSEALSVAAGMEEPISVLISFDIGRKRLPRKTTEEEIWGLEGTVSLAAAKDTSLDAASSFTIKEEQRTQWRSFWVEQMFLFISDCLREEFG